MTYIDHWKSYLPSYEDSLVWKWAPCHLPNNIGLHSVLSPLRSGLDSPPLLWLVCVFCHTSMIKTTIVYASSCERMCISSLWGLLLGYPAKSSTRRSVSIKCMCCTKVLCKSLGDNVEGIHEFMGSPTCIRARWIQYLVNIKTSRHEWTPWFWASEWVSVNVWMSEWKWTREWISEWVSEQVSEAVSQCARECVCNEKNTFQNLSPCLKGAM